MEDKVQVLLDEVIERDIQRLSTCDVGSEERTKTIEELTELHKMRIEEVKAVAAKADKQEQSKAQNLDRWINFGAQVGLTVGGWIMFSLWQSKEQRFELTGTPTSPIFRGLLSKMIPRIK